MADRTTKVVKNSDGRYYVDSQCIDCSLCQELAAENFSKDESSEYAFVSKQPVNEDEETQCKEALMTCPVDAIGDDGEKGC